MVMERVSAVLQASDVTFALGQRFRLRRWRVDGRVDCGGCCIAGGGGQGTEADEADWVHQRGRGRAQRGRLTGLRCCLLLGADGQDGQKVASMAMHDSRLK
jgi:hypothetical protein